MEEIEVVINIAKHEWEYLNKLVENGDQLGHYERLVVNGTPLPDNATNGDVIKTLFAEYRVVDTLDGFIRIIDPIYNLATKGRLKKDWWNAPYKAESEDKK